MISYLLYNQNCLDELEQISLGIRGLEVSLIDTAQSQGVFGDNIADEGSNIPFRNKYLKLRDIFVYEVFKKSMLILFKAS